MSEAKYHHRQLGQHGPMVSSIGYGSMGFSSMYGALDVDHDSLLDFAMDRGLTFWDCADSYPGSEVVLGNWFERNPSKRQAIFLATKFGYTRISRDGSHEPGLPVPCSDPRYIVEAFHNSLARLKTTYIDLYYQHRVDPNVPIEVVLETLRPFVESGQIKYLGLSECSLETLKRAKNVPDLGDKVIAAQMEFSPFTLDIEKNGFAKGAEELGVSIVAYSPLARGMLTGRWRSRSDFQPNDARLRLPRFSEDNFHKNLIIVDKMKAIADRIGCTAGQVALAWILAEHPSWIPIPGSRTVQRIDENAGAAEIVLQPADVKAVRTLVESSDVGGMRIMAPLLSSGECIAMAEWSGENVQKS